MGNTEYKLKFEKFTNLKLQKRTSQMEHRLREGKGTAFYFIGLEDNGNPIGINQEAMFYSLYFLNEMADKLEVELVVLDFLKGINGIIAHISIK